MIATETGHIPVLLREAIDNLIWNPDGRYVDGTFGGGGHSTAILNQFPGASIIGFDRDPAAIERARSLAESLEAGRLIPIYAGFAEMTEELTARNLTPVDGILLDLGFSSFQIDDPERGFAFRNDGPLDMRFDRSSGISAAELLATYDEAVIADILWRFGDERRSRQIARAIVADRETAPVQTTTRLAELVARVVGYNSGRGHPATRTFQALRIAVNGELDQLERVLEASLDVLREGGRLVVISFHSLEDRIVKQFIADQARTCVCPPEQVICTCETVPTLRKVGKAIHPSAQEEATNPRSRSAIMRVAERLPQSGGTT
jgi:16S rRNA (cytosine1402-N4)-methyltransferase